MDERLTINSGITQDNEHSQLPTGQGIHYLPAGGEPIMPKPETAQFASEVEAPTFISSDGMSLGVFRLNRTLEQLNLLPVGLILPLGEDARSGAGRADLNAFVQTIERPIVVIDMPGLGASGSVPFSRVARISPERLSTSYLAAYDQLGIDQLDLIGWSLGAILATKIAELGRERIKHLITFSAPSFERKSAWELYQNSRQKNIPDFRNASANAPPLVREELEAFKTARRVIRRETSARVKTKNFAVVLRQASIVREPHMSDIADRLAPNTTWSDVTGSEDAFSDWHSHFVEVQRRNKNHPGTSTLTVLDDETHAWLAVHRWDMAKMAASALTK